MDTQERTRSARKRWRSTVFAAAICAAAAGSLLATGRTAWRAQVRQAREQPILTIDEDGYRYSFQAVTGDEALYDLAADPRGLRNLAAAEPARVSAMRRDLAARLHVADVHSLMKRDAETARLLKSLGYL